MKIASAYAHGLYITIDLADEAFHRTYQAWHGSQKVERTILVTTIRAHIDLASASTGNVGLRLVGPILRKDGTPGQRSDDIYVDGHEIPAKARILIQEEWRSTVAGYKAWPSVVLGTRQ